MHKEAKEFTEFAKQLFPSYFEEKTVLDVGSGDINGNNRYLFNKCSYFANDVIEAPNVNIVCKTKDLPFSKDTMDTIISTECFEHDPEYRDSLKKIVSILKPGGLFVFTCASEGRPEHGTRRTSPKDSYGTIGGMSDMKDYYKNLNINDVKLAIDCDGVFSAYDFYYQPVSKDLYFIGVKRKSLPGYINALKL